MEMLVLEKQQVKTSTQNEIILLVEDDVLNKELTTIYLRNVCKLDHAASGLAAVEMSISQQYSLILMDINLGAGINGIEAAKRIRLNDNYRDVPIVAITAFAMSGDESRLLAEGFDYYLSKPFEKKALVGLVENVLMSKYHEHSN
ncbi:MAG: response regulator [Ignavibacteriales bacterium]|nr:MAG: response regulator [Ignavibacteriales bacterium]